jgi:hypothetical protein
MVGGARCRKQKKADGEIRTWTTSMKTVMTTWAFVDELLKERVIYRFRFRNFRFPGMTTLSKANQHWSLWAYSCCNNLWSKLGFRRNFAPAARQLFNANAALWLAQRPIRVRDNGRNCAAPTLGLAFQTSAMEWFWYSLDSCRVKLVGI